MSLQPAASHPPAAADASQEARYDAADGNPNADNISIDVLIRLAQNGYGADSNVSSLCKETRCDEQMWAAIKDIRGAGPRKRTRLMFAARKGDLARVRFLLECGANMSIVDDGEDGFNALHWACWEGPLSIVRELLARGANIAAVTRNGSTSLYASSRNGHLDVVRELLARGANTETA